MKLLTQFGNCNKIRITEHSMLNTKREKYNERKFWAICKRQEVFLPFLKEYRQKLPKKLKRHPHQW